MTALSYVVQSEIDWRSCSAVVRFPTGQSEDHASIRYELMTKAFLFHGEECNNDG